MLYDGVGLDLPDTAAETEASTRAAAGRLLYAREVLAERLPEPAGPRELHDRLAELASSGRTRAAEPAAVRVGGERRARLWTRTAAAVTVVLIGSTAMTLHTAPTHYVPPVPPGETVRGVPPRAAPGPLSDDQRELRDRLREALLDGPERLTPRPAEPLPRAPAKTGGPVPTRGTGPPVRCAVAPAVQPARIARASLAVSVGVLPTLTPAASRASFFACAVPEEPETMAPA